MNLLVDPDTGHLQGVIEWADAALWPFGIALWGVESILGYSNSDGWFWLDENVHSLYRAFGNRFVAEVGELPMDTLAVIEASRVFGILLRYGFDRKDGMSVVTDDIMSLEVFLGRKHNQTDRIGRVLFA